MIFNFCPSVKFQTRLQIDGTPLEQVSDCRLLGIQLNDRMKWTNNTKSLVQRAYQRMSIIRNLSSFRIQTEELIHIYSLYIRSILEQSSVNHRE